MSRQRIRELIKQDSRPNQSVANEIRATAEFKAKITAQPIPEFHEFDVDEKSIFAMCEALSLDVNAVVRLNQSAADIIKIETELSADAAVLAQTLCALANSEKITRDDFMRIRDGIIRELQSNPADPRECAIEEFLRNLNIAEK